MRDTYPFPFCDAESGAGNSTVVVPGDERAKAVEFNGDRVRGEAKFADRATVFSFESSSIERFYTIFQKL